MLDHMHLLDQAQALFYNQDLLHDRKDDGVAFLAHGHGHFDPTSDRHMPNLYLLLH